MAESGGGLTWFFKLIDGVSGPAMKATGSLQGMSKAFKAVDDATGKTGTITQWERAITSLFGKKTGDNLFGPVREGIQVLGRIDKLIPLDVIKQVGGGLMAAGGVFFSAISSLVEVAGGIAVAVGVTAATITAIGFKFAAEAADFRRNTIFGLQTMLGTGDEARKTLDELEGFAKRTGMGKESFVGFATHLLRNGFKEGELKPLLGALADVQAANGGDINAANTFMAQLQRVKETDKTSARQLVAFGSIGLDSEKIFKALADQQHITLTQAKTLFDKGKVDSKVAIDAILTAVSTNFDQGNKLGSLGEKFGLGSLAVQFQHLTDAFHHMFEGVDTGPLVEFLKRLTDGLSGEGGDKIAAAINRAFASISKLFDKFTSDDIAATIDKIAAAFEKTITFTIDFFTELDKGVDKVKGPLSTTYGLLFGDSEVGSGWREALALIGGIAASSLMLWGILLKIGESVFDIGAVFLQIGLAIVEGLWAGITEGWGAMLEKFSALVELLPLAVKRVLGIASPSKVMFELGMNTGEGFTGGIERSDLSGVMSDAVTPPPGAGSGGGAAGPYASRAQGGGGVYYVNLNFAIEAKGQDAHELADELAPLMLDGLSSALEQLGIEQGS